MSVFKIALLQMLPTGTVEHNLVKGLAFCKQAKAMGADLALFPEVWQTGYAPEAMNINFAINNDDPFVLKHIELAQELQMAIAITYLKKDATGLKNNMLLIDKEGQIILEYAKVHICDFEGGTEPDLSHGEKFHVAELDFGTDTIKIGAMICMDREFFESARTLTLKGAELIIVPNACPLATDDMLGDARLAGFRSTAYQEIVAVAMTNYASPRNDGHSCAFDSLGTEVVMADDREQVVIAQFNVDQLRCIRGEEWDCRGQPGRRPEAYEI